MKAGRPRAFDRDEALERALEVFWRRGYEGASMAELTRAMGINPPSLYAAFGNKESLFRQALDRYAEGHGDFLRQVIAAPTAREAAEFLLHGSAERATLPGRPAGCLLMQAGLACGSGAEAIPSALAEHRAGIECLLRTRFERARHEGDLAANADPATLARYLSTIVQGMAVQAAAGATRAELEQVAALSLKAFP